MEAIIQFIQTERNTTAKDLVKTKLDQLYQKYDWLIRADVFFKEEKDTNRGLGKICEIRLSCPGPRIFAQSNASTFEESAAKTIEELSGILEKRKSELYAY